MVFDKLKLKQGYILQKRCHWEDKEHEWGNENRIKGKQAIRWDGDSKQSSRGKIKQELLKEGTAGYILSDMCYLIWRGISEILHGEQSGEDILRNDLPPGMCEIIHMNEPQ